MNAIEAFLFAWQKSQSIDYPDEEYFRKATAQQKINIAKNSIPANKECLIIFG